MHESNRLPLVSNSITPTPNLLLLVLKISRNTFIAQNKHLYREFVSGILHIFRDFIGNQITSPRRKRNTQEYPKIEVNYYGNYYFAYIYPLERNVYPVWFPTSASPRASVTPTKLFMFLDYYCLSTLYCRETFQPPSCIYAFMLTAVVEA